VEQGNLERQKPKRSWGIILVVIYSVISAFPNLFFAIFTVRAGRESQFMATLVAETGLSAAFNYNLAMFCLVLGLLLLVLSYGLWSWKPWGYNLARIVYLISIPLGIWYMLVIPKTVQVIVPQIIGLGLDIWVLLYLFKPRVRELYLKETAA
jgi:uncharacterized membrane protein (DUF2068 family)